MCQGLRCENLHATVDFAVIFICLFGLMMDNKTELKSVWCLRKVFQTSQLNVYFIILIVQNTKQKSMFYCCK